MEDSNVCTDHSDQYLVNFIKLIYGNWSQAHILFVLEEENMTGFYIRIQKPEFLWHIF